jgi:citrate lyase gamma subunit
MKIPRSALGILSSLEHASALIKVNAQDCRRVTIKFQGRVDRRLGLVVEELLHDIPVGANKDGVLRRELEGA